MKKLVVLSLAMLLCLPGCWGKKKQSSPKAGKSAKVEKKDKMKQKKVLTNNEKVKSFFDEDIDAFVLEEDADSKALNSGGAAFDVASLEKSNDKLSVEDNLVDVERSDSFKTVYFDFDQYGVKEDQADVVNKNIEAAKEIVKKGGSLVIEAHACNSAGSSVYNYALSEKRASAIANELIEAGIPKSNIKVVGRGKDMPVIIDGKPLVSKDRKAQWRNRRGEFFTLSV
ncbi:MAG: Peptidoglycan-associated lipoprotein [candidate division TM6 bacterium GW2011_GWF2_32_72]|nr:MAG: Peptidoglycan-associated lipoprotein [candidate division TM6 bacterium GW2011_GWF2_32_72]